MRYPFRSACRADVDNHGAACGNSASSVENRISRVTMPLLLVVGLMTSASFLSHLELVEGGGLVRRAAAIHRAVPATLLPVARDDGVVSQPHAFLSSVTPLSRRATPCRPLPRAQGRLRHPCPIAVPAPQHPTRAAGEDSATRTIRPPAEDLRDPNNNALTDTPAAMRQAARPKDSDVPLSRGCRPTEKLSEAYSGV